MELTWLGCASYKLVCGNVTLWTDPFISMSDEAENFTTEETFEEAREILISHGHFDHLMSVPEFNDQREIRVHCTETPHETLLKLGIPEQRINLCAPGETFHVGDVSVRVFQGRHNVPDFKMVLGAVLRTVSSPRRIVNFFRMAFANKQFPEAGETVIFEIKHGGKRVLSMGSPGLPEDVIHPSAGADLLILPYNGLSDLVPQSLDIVEKLAPKAVLLSHHDNAIPPLTGKTDTASFVEAMAELYPDIPVRIPDFGREMALAEIMGIAGDAEKEHTVRIA